MLRRQDADRRADATQERRYSTFSLANGVECEYYFGMKRNTKSSITLPPEELRLVLSLQAKLKAKSKVDVVRRGLRLLEEVTDRERLREAYRLASLATRGSLTEELKELDPLVSEGLNGS